MDLKLIIYNYLQTQQLMSLTTLGTNPWPAIVYFIADQDLNLYFISHPHDLHCRNLEKEPRVGIAIYSSEQPNSGDKIGVQFSGSVKVVNNLEKVKWMLDLWKKLIAGPQPGDLLEVGGSRVYKVLPEKIKFFNTKLFPKNNFQILEF